MRLILRVVENQVEDVDLPLQNQTTKIIFLKAVPHIEFSGNMVGPFEKDGEAELPQWVAEELVESGFAKYSGSDALSTIDVTKAHWRESLPKSRSMSSLNAIFYYKLRRLLKDLKVEGQKDVEKQKEYEKILSMANDILNCRLQKIVILASSRYRSEEVKKNLTFEEIILLEELSKVIEEWRKGVLKA